MNQRLFDILDNPDAQRRQAQKKEGKYHVVFESVEIRPNVDTPEYPFDEFNIRMKLVNGPSKGVEFVTIGVPPQESPTFRAKEYDDDGEPVIDPQTNQPKLTDRPNGNWKRRAGLFTEFIQSALIGDAVKGRSEKAKAERNALLDQILQATGASDESEQIRAALEGRECIVTMQLDRGFTVNRETGEKRVYSEKLQENPKLKVRYVMPFSEDRLKKYVLNDDNLNPTNHDDTSF